MSRIAVIADFTLRPDGLEQYKQALSQHAQRCRNEPGCLQFAICIPRDSPSRVMHFEMFADQAALDLHNQTDYLKRFQQQYQAWVAERKVVYCDVAER